MINLIQNALGFIFNKKNFSIYDSSKEILTSISVLRYSVLDDSQIMKSPIESGVLVSDQQIFNPIEISCEVAFPSKDSAIERLSIDDLINGSTQSFEDAFKELQYYYKNSLPVQVKTKAKVYPNMYITSIPSDVNPDNIDRQIFSIRFEQTLIVEPEYVKIPSKSVNNKSNASVVKSGEVSTKEAPQSLLSRWL